MKAGADADIMLDCYMGLDLPYAIELGRSRATMACCGWKSPSRRSRSICFCGLRDAVPDLLLTAGEHEFSRWAFRPLLERQGDRYRSTGYLSCGRHI